MDVRVVIREEMPDEDIRTQLDPARGRGVTGEMRRPVKLSVQAALRNESE
jgi:hypothetical protein